MLNLQERSEFSQGKQAGNDAAVFQSQFRPVPIAQRAGVQKQRRAHIAAKRVVRMPEQRDLAAKFFRPIGETAQTRFYAIPIAVRKEEIAIMKYIGATDIFVRGPFLVEGIVIGLIGSAIPVLLLRFVYVEIVQFITNQFPVVNAFLTFSSVDEIFRILLPISLVIGLGIGFIGSYITLRKHIRV